MNAYISRVVINVSADDVLTASTITVDYSGNADLQLRFPPPNGIRARELKAIALQEVGVDGAGMVRWATVGPEGGEDTVLVATDRLMEQVKPAFQAIKMGQL